MQKYAEEYRRILLSKLTRKNAGSKPAEVLEAEKIISKYRKEHKNIELQLSRLESSDCPGSVCPNCFYTRGLSVHLKNSDGNDEEDRFKWPDCNHVYTETI